MYQKIEFLICNNVQCASYTINPLRFVFCISTVIKLQIGIDIIFTHDQRKESVRKMLLLELFLVQVEGSNYRIGDQTRGGGRRVSVRKE